MVVDGNTYNTTQTLSWASGSSHSVAVTSPQSGGAGVRYVWRSWIGLGNNTSYTVAPTKNTTYTASFTKQYYLTTNAGNGGKVSPASGWRNSGVTVPLTATPTNNSLVSYSFSSWSGAGTGSYSGGNNPCSVVMNGPLTESAAFTQNPIQVTVQSNVTGPTFTVDGNVYSSTQTFTWTPGSTHTIATTSPQSGGTGIRYMWTDGPISRIVTPTQNTTYTEKFTTQYYLTMSTGTGGKVSPSSGWRNNGATVSITATPLNGYGFSNWTGSGLGSYSGAANPKTITIEGPITEKANFTH